MDVLAAVMSELHLNAAQYRRLELGAPWAVSFGQNGLRGIHIVLEGRCEAYFGHRPPVTLAAGDLVIAPRADPHILRSPGSDQCSPMPAALLATVAKGGHIQAGGSGEPTVILCGAFVFRESDHPALAGLPRMVHVEGSNGQPPAWLRGYIDVLLTEALEQGAGGDVVMARLTAAIITRALRDVALRSDEPGWVRGLGDPSVARALGTIHESCSRPWTLQTLAREAGLSRAAFASRFRDLVGEPPMRYMFRRRMRLATGLLLKGKPIAHVADAVGYGSEAAFATAFKRYTGTSPGELRKQLPADEPGRQAS